MSSFRVLRCVFVLTVTLFSFAAHAQFSSPMRDVENPDRFPYQESASGNLDTPYVNGFIFFPTPLGKRYVLEFLSLFCTTPSAADTFTQAYLSVTKATSPTSTSGVVAMPLSMERRGAAPFGGYIWSGSAVIKMYSDPIPFATNGGNGISMNIFHTDTSVRPSCTATLTGHSITNP